MINVSIQVRSLLLLVLTAALSAGITGCSSDAAPTEVAVKEGSEAAAAVTSFGPFPARTTIFVDVDNQTGVEDGSREHPFNTLREGLAAARSGDGVGLAPGVYFESFATPPSQNYLIDGLKDFRLLGSGVSRTTIRGDHSGSLIQVLNGASALIKDLTIEQGGHSRHSEGGGIQVVGHSATVTLTVQNVHLRDNAAVNGGAISAEGNVALRLINVLAANNRADNGCGGVFLLGLSGATGAVRAVIKNSTITENAANFEAGGICVQNGAVLNLINSIVYGNSLGEVVGHNAGRLSVSYSDVGEKLFPGPGNISASPRFVNRFARDYRIRGDSPAVDAGTNEGTPRTDIRGLARPHDGNGDGIAVTDMGAYEFGKVF